MKLTAGQKIRELRMAKGISQRELSQRACLSHVVVSELERGLAGGRVGEAGLRRIAAVLGFDPDLLVCLAGRVPADICSWLAERPEQVAALRREMERSLTPARK